jgi:hypothetical protein
MDNHTFFMMLYYQALFSKERKTFAKKFGCNVPPPPPHPQYYIRISSLIYDKTCVHLYRRKPFII